VTLLLRQDDVERLATMELALDAMAEVFRHEGEGHTGVPGRHDMPTGKGWLRLMPVAVAGMGTFGFKAMHLTKGVGVRYVIWVYELETGALRGILDARVVTAMRTAATTGLATEALANRSNDVTAVIGTGQEARTHLLAMQAVRPAPVVRIFSRSAENRALFIKEMTEQVDATLVDCASLREATEGAGVVVLATKSPTPVFAAADLEPGMHVNSIGSARTEQHELAPDAFTGFATVVCDSREHVFAEAGDAVAALEQGHYAVERADNLADLVVGRARGRRAPDEVTLFKSVGTATQDVALATRLLDLAIDAGLGQELGGFPEMKAFA
jgi:ornithine cyclodeaminase/alanine dehydrogenase-like protein (mu-crystallin family)